MRRPHRKHPSAFKAKVVMSALKGEGTLSVPEVKFDIFPNQIMQRKTTLLENAFGVFAAVAEKHSADRDLKGMRAKISEQVLQNDFLASALGCMGDVSTNR